MGPIYIFEMSFGLTVITSMLLITVVWQFVIMGLVRYLHC